jgi:hypothetical protein
MDTKLNPVQGCDAGKHQPRAAVPAPSMNCSRGNSDQYRFRRECGALEQHVLQCWQLHSVLSASILTRAAVLVIELDRSPWKRAGFQNIGKAQELDRTV